LWPNGWMDQDATWYGGRPRPTRHYVLCGPSYLQKKGTPTPTQFLAHVYCGQFFRWMKTPLGTEVDLGSGYIVLDGVPAPRKGHSSPPRSPISATVELLYRFAAMKALSGVSPCDIVLDGDLPPPKKKEAQQSPSFRPMYCGQTAGWINMPLGIEVGLGPGHIVLDETHPPKGTQSPNFRCMSVVAKLPNRSRCHLVGR